MKIYVPQFDFFFWWREHEFIFTIYTKVPKISKIIWIKIQTRKTEMLYDGRAVENPLLELCVHFESKFEFKTIDHNFINSTNYITQKNLLKTVKE